MTYPTDAGIKNEGSGPTFPIQFLGGRQTEEGAVGLRILPGVQVPLESGGLLRHVLAPLQQQLQVLLEGILGDQLPHSQVCCTGFGKSLFKKNFRKPCLLLLRSVCREEYSVAGVTISDVDP
jgi:hypothetical protein